MIRNHRKPERFERLAKGLRKAFGIARLLAQRKRGYGPQHETTYSLLETSFN